ncbi:MAG: VanW family protein [Candidatus Doudnabacteria bacterium]
MSLSKLKINTIARSASDEAILTMGQIAAACGLAMVIFFSFAIPKPAHAKTLSFGDKKWELEPNFVQTVDEISVRNDFDLLELSRAAMFGSELKQTTRLFDEATISAVDQVELDVDQQTHDAVLKIDNHTATFFDPGQNGQALDLYALRDLLTSDSPLVDLPVLISLPKHSLGQTNDLGIKELVATGESNFKGSPSNRIHNIKIGAQKFNGVVVGAGEEFSFNKFLGDVDDKHGFLPELVIKPEGVIPEFGGGLCQVSTTTFRAAMNAGLPITARRNHSFAVQYYAPQGTDATIYPGSSDLKFTNNLASALLIRTRIEDRKLYFDFYGTKDDRSISFDGPTVYDRKTDGSMKATWTRHVTLNDQTTDQTFRSTYLPPALFHHDAVVVPSIPNPQIAGETLVPITPPVVQ